MSGVVTLSLLSNVPDYTPYNTLPPYNNVPYDPTLCESPASQFYTYLMTLPEFKGGTKYPQ